MTDDYKIAIASATIAMTSDCKEQTLRDLKYWKKDSRGNLAPPEEIGNSLCPNECSGHGTCQNATCICDLEYVTADCSLKKGQTPILRGIPAHGLCDIRKRDCIRTRVMGMDFMESENLTCRMTEVIVSDKPYIETTRQTNHVAQLLSYGEIICLLPHVPVKINGNPGKSLGQPAGGFLIEVSNDGQMFSKKKSLFLVYDSKCMNCSQDYRRCFLKDNSCKVKNYCFSTGEANPNDWCQVCDPKKRIPVFVKRTVNKPPIINAPKGELKTLRKQSWRYVISASDPEKQTLRYEIVGDRHNMSISSHGVVTWYPILVEEYIFTVKVIDPCGLSVSLKLVVNVETCSCDGHNNGICIWKDGKSFCKCLDGCKGERCDEAVEGKTCKIRKTTPEQALSSDGKTTMIIIVVVSVFLAVSVFLVCIVVFYKNKHKRSVNLKTRKIQTFDDKHRAAKTDVVLFNGEDKVHVDGLGNKGFLVNDDCRD